MPPLSDLRKELKALRKEHVKPVSRMRKGDVSAEIEKLRGSREETAPVASTLGASPKKSKSEVENIKEAKAKEFPMKPTAYAAKAAAPKTPKAKASKLDRLMAMMNELSSDEE